MQLSFHFDSIICKADKNDSPQLLFVVKLFHHVVFLKTMKKRVKSVYIFKGA